MIVVSGCPRSGTSMMTHTIGELLSDEGYQIRGSKFPQENRDLELRRFNISEKLRGESDQHYDLRKYVVNKHMNSKNPRMMRLKKRIEKNQEALEKVKDMNRYGFWECDWTVQGCSYKIGMEKIMEKKIVAKIVSQGLKNTDPRFLTEGKMIMMVRNPREVAKSQERLTNPTPEVQKIIDMDSDSKPHSPDMFNRVSVMAARWFKNSGFDPLIVDYDDFCADHEKHIDRIIAYLGMGNKEKAMAVLDITQKRSKSAELDTEKFDLADEIYKLMLVKDWDGIIKLNEPEKQTQHMIQCLRVNQKLDEAHCLECQKGGDFTKTCIKIAERQKIDWKNTPCVYECGEGRDIEHIFVQESIDNNHWNDVK